MSLPLARMSRSLTRLLITQMCGAITRLITKAATRLLTQMGQALTSLLTKTGQATLKLLSKMLQAFTRSSTRQSYGRRSSHRPLIRISTRSGVTAGKPPPSEHVSHHSIGINVDNNDELHEAKIVTAGNPPPSKHVSHHSTDINVGNNDELHEAKIITAGNPPPSKHVSHHSIDINVDNNDELHEAKIVTAGNPPPSKHVSHHSTDIDVDNNDEPHEAMIVPASPATGDEGNLADACGEDDVVVSESSYEEAVVKLNESPEKQAVKWGRVGMYGGWQRILLVGEGDFSFSACLGNAFGDASNMVATSLDTLGFLKKNYEKAKDNIKQLRSRGCKVIHKVDATKMANHPKLCSSKFDRIIYNFPHAGFGKLKGSREMQISHHQALILGFIENAKQMIEGDGQIHITHKCGSKFSTEWNIDELGKSKGLHPLKAGKFKLKTYPGYRTKYGYGGDKDFDCNPSKTHKFILPPEKKNNGISGSK